VPIATSFTEVWDAMNVLRRLMMDRSYASVALQHTRIT